MTSNQYLSRQTVNKKEELCVERVFVQGKFTKPMFCDSNKSASGRMGLDVCDQSETAAETPTAAQSEVSQRNNGEEDPRDPNRRNCQPASAVDDSLLWDAKCVTRESGDDC